ncbi:MAG: hypothetical protein RDU20_17570 [Desulfomonilaceae bacterium]|nr:hypothetical protein [Desulfomonilaceae bacterium]
MPIRITKKTRQGSSIIARGTAQLIDEVMSIDEPVVLKECEWKATISGGDMLWTIEIEKGDDLRGYIQAELQKRTKRRE